MYQNVQPGTPENKVQDAAWPTLQMSMWTLCWTHLNNCDNLKFLKTGGKKMSLLSSERAQKHLCTCTWCGPTGWKTALWKRTLGLWWMLCWTWAVCPLPLRRLMAPLCCIRPSIESRLREIFSSLQHWWAWRAVSSSVLPRRDMDMLERESPAKDH